MTAANALAWLYATCPDPKIRNGKEAFRLAGVLLQQERMTWNERDTLAAVYAEVGDFREAVRFQKAALDDVARFNEDKLDYEVFNFDLSARNEQKKQAIEIAERLEMYRNKKPFRQPNASN